MLSYVGTFRDYDFKFLKVNAFTYNTILSINTFFQLGAKCMKKKGEWSPCTESCNGEKSRIIYYKKYGKDKAGAKKLKCKKSKAEIKNCNKKNVKCIIGRLLPGKRRSG